MSYVKKIKETEDRLKSTLTPDELNNFTTKQDEFLSKFKGDLQDQKRRKWYCDIQDYSAGRVYSWNMRPT